MARFPISEVEIAKLGEEVINGLIKNPDDFPDPPVPADELGTDLLAFVKANDDVVAARAAAEAATTAKNTIKAAFVQKLKDVLRWAERITNMSDDLLKKLGWGAHAEPTPLEKPGQCDTFVATEQGAGWIKFKWDEPTKGGEPSAYRILRRKHSDYDWTLVEVAMHTEERVEDQERGVQWDYCVVAQNKAGKGPESNIVTATL